MTGVQTDPVPLPKNNQSQDVRKIVELSGSYTVLLNEKIKTNPSANSWSLDIEGSLYSLEYRAALQVAARFDLTEDYGAAVISDRIPSIVVVRKGLNPHTRDYQSEGHALTGNLPGRQDVGAKIDRSDPIFATALGHLDSVKFGNRKADPTFDNDVRKYFNNGDAESLKCLFGR